MATTTADGLPVPVIDDSPDVPRDILALAQTIGPELLQKFTTNTQRDTAFATVPFSMCNVAGVYYRRVGTQWVDAGGLGWGGGDLTNATAQGITVSAWTKLGMPTSGGTFDGDGIAAHTGGQGISVTAAGRYQVSGFTLWDSSSSGGLRQCGIAASTASNPGFRARNSVPTWGGSLNTEVACSGEITMPANSIISLFAAQTGGGTIAVLDRVLQVRRVA
jgi:hypothetical protein